MDAVSAPAPGGHRVGELVQQHDERPSADVSHPLTEIAAQVGGDVRVDGPDAHGVALSTAGVRPGDLFVAAAGASTHGAHFAADALAAGAVGVTGVPGVSGTSGFFTSSRASHCAGVMVTVERA